MDHFPASVVINALPFPALVSDSEMRILHANTDAGAILGQENAGDFGHLIGRSLLDAISAEERERFESAVDELTDDGESPSANHAQIFEVTRQTPHGARICQVTATALRNPKKRPFAVLFTSRDIASLREDNRRSEHEAARMDVARQLAATLNHEINNPLFIVSATLEDLLAEIDEPAKQRRLKAALDAVWRVSGAVKQLSEIRQLVTTAYIDGFPMIDLEASQERPEPQ